MNKTILLIGGNGFIGTHCIDWWMRHTDWNIITLDYNIVQLQLLRRLFLGAQRKRRLKVLGHDLTHPISETLLEKKIDYIVNLAGDTNLEKSVENPVDCCRNNFNIIMHVLEFVRKAYPKMFIHVSTNEVYGKGEHKEWDSIIPVTPYSGSKAAQEAIAISYWNTYRIPLVLLNTMHVIGEHQPRKRFIPTIIKHIAKNEEVQIFGQSFNGKGFSVGKRNYTDVKCLASAIQFIVENENPRASDPCLRFHVADQQIFDNLSLAETIAAIMGKELNWKFVDKEFVRPGQNETYLLNSDRIRNDGWQQPFTMKESLERIVKWHLDNPHW
jgi:dTDP-D-glucose 4,6-dehydratase